MKEGEPNTEKILPPNITVAWGRSDIAFGEITFRIPGDKRVHLGRIFRDEGHIEEVTWWQLLSECIREATKNPQNSYHLVRIDNSNYVPEDINNAPFRMVDGKWQDKVMTMFGYKYISKVQI